MILIVLKLEIPNNRETHNRETLSEFQDINRSLYTNKSRLLSAIYNIAR
jgi:hypothetical protein